jgi:hypothetical protein
VPLLASPATTTKTTDLSGFTIEPFAVFIAAVH